MPTPFKKDGELDEAALKELIAHYEDTGVNGLLIMGTAGEFAMMNEAERRRVADIARDAAKKLELIINAGWASTKETIALARHIKDAGADAVTVVEPYFYHPSKEGMARHFLTVAEKVDFPVVAYNIPSFAGNALPADIIDDFAKEERIVGIKDSEGNPAKLQEFIERAPKDFAVMVGMDSLVSFGICLGAKGMMVGSAAIAPSICVDVHKAIVNGDFYQAFELQKRLNHVIKAMQVGTFPAPIKYSLSLEGLPSGYVRAPLEDLTATQKKEVEYHLRAAEILEPMEMTA